MASERTQRQRQLVDYKVSDISPDVSFLEMLDELNKRLVKKNEEPVAFDSDCREGICGSGYGNKWLTSRANPGELQPANCT